MVESNGGAGLAGVRERTAELRQRQAAADASTKSDASQQDIAASKEAHANLIKARNTHYDHSYGHVDMRDDQIVGGGKETALQKYNPGIIISEKGREQDKKLDEHYE